MTGKIIGLDSNGQIETELVTALNKACGKEFEEAVLITKAFITRH